MTSRPAAAQHLRDLARPRRVRDRIEREDAHPLDVEGARPRRAHVDDQNDQESRSAVKKWSSSKPGEFPSVPAGFLGFEIRVPLADEQCGHAGSTR